jgi:hypothetical protein
MPTHSSCPTAVVEAPVEVVWALLTEPSGWGGFFDVRIARVEPSGFAAVGQRIYAESGPRFLHLEVTFEFTEIDPARHTLGLDVRLPLGITVREELGCHPLGPSRCRVDYHCNFGMPEGWRGELAHLVLRRELDAGPLDSLSRLKRAAEERYAGLRGPHVPGETR